MGLPALCVELKLAADNGVAIVNSRDVATVFGKRHDNVLRNIEALETSSKLRGSFSSWFRRSSYRDEYGREQRSYGLTRDGFTLLVMGWTGDKALEFKLRYIEAFNAMEAALQDMAPATVGHIKFAMREIVAPLTVRFEQTDRAILHLGEEVSYCKTEIVQTKQQVQVLADNVVRILPRRREVKDSTRWLHINAITRMGGFCPCGCGTMIVKDGAPIKGVFQVDHFYTNQSPDAEHTWPLAAKCHRDLTTGKVPRIDRKDHFNAYQMSRKRLPDLSGQMTLF